MNDKRQQRIYNGLCKAHDGFRQVLVSEKMALRPVVLRLYQGYIAKRATVQVEPIEGDYLFKVEWTKETENDCILKWHNNAWEAVNINEYNDLWQALTKAYPWSVEFLARSPLGESYMPWEGYTLAEKAKAKRAKQFLKTWRIRQFTLDAFIQSPKDKLHYDPQPAPEDLLDRIPAIKTLEIHGETTVYKEHWYMDLGNRVVKLDYAAAPDQPLRVIVPNTAKTLICITEGAYEREGAYEGLAVYVYTLT